MRGKQIIVEMLSPAIEDELLSLTKFSPEFVSMGKVLNLMDYFVESACESAINSVKSHKGFPDSLRKKKRRRLSPPVNYERGNVDFSSLEALSLRYTETIHLIPQKVKRKDI